ncbi:hypothetical protein ACW4FP_04640 [Paenarthrobacter ureafaciens]
MRIYNSPPNWPTPPPGWQPPAGWQPNPAWGPAPTGHQFWLDVPDAPHNPQEQGKALTTTAFVLAAIGLVLFWIPVLNILALLLGLAAAVMGVIALVNGKKNGRPLTGLAIAATAIGAVALLGAVVTVAAYSSGSRATAVAKDATPTGSPEASASPATSSVPSKAPSPSAAAPDPEPGSASQPHPLGTSAVVGKEYRAAVTGVKFNATDEVIANNMFNDPPKGQYVLVDIAVTYAGTEEGTPWIDLSPTFVGTDARQYDASSCGASLTSSVMQVPTLEQGGSANYQVCMDVPVGAVEGGKIFIQERLSFNSKSRTYWGLK